MVETYQLVDLLPDHVRRLSDGVYLAPDSDGYADYLAWVKAGNAVLTVAETPAPSQIRTQAFFDRFTDAEKAAIWPASVASAELGVGLVHGLANGSVNLLGPDAKAWLDGLVAAKVITAERAVEILTP